jgi:acyl transferase domain-containing protein
LEPIAIVGIGCRFPGNANSPEDLWTLLKEEQDIIEDIPQDRLAQMLPAHATEAQRKLLTRQGGYLTDIDRFAASFFDIAPKEARYIDPQQRLLMEVAWEALEDANQVLDEELKAQTGVFVGLWTNDYETYMYNTHQPVNLYMTTGGSHYAASGRLSYVLDARGPSMTVDTACSSSLVALHLACQSLRAGECSLALVGGANLILQPYITLGYARSKMLSPDHRCKFGDTQANGYVRSEGVAVVLLKRLSRAIEEQNTIYAVIQGSSINNDGQESGSLVAPSLEGQISLLRTAYRVAGISPGQVCYVEAHGTGTKAGDYAELHALGTVLREGRAPDNHCRIGSVKTNIGHTEATSGLAGLIKVALCLKHRAIPASLHHQTPSERIPWHGLPLKIQRHFEKLPSEEECLYAAVNSFGITGTNVHVVLRTPPAGNTAPTAETPRHSLLLLSAHNKHTLHMLIDHYSAFLQSVRQNQSISLDDICTSAGLGRKHMPYRIALIASSKDDAIAQLQTLNEDKEGVYIKTARLPPVFVFGESDADFQVFNSLEQDPICWDICTRCHAHLRKYTNWSLLDLLSTNRKKYPVWSASMKRVVTFVSQAAFIALWHSWGIPLEMTIGYGVGELAASYATGELQLEDGLFLAFAGKRRTSHMPELLRSSSSSGLVKNATNGVSQKDAFQSLVAPYHVTTETPVQDMVHPSDTTAFDTWNTIAVEQPHSEHTHSPEELLGTINELVALNYSVFIEVGSGTHSQLSSILQNSLKAHMKTGHLLYWPLTKEDQRLNTLHLLRYLYLSGCSADWKRFFKGRRDIQLPKYPWHRERFWLEEY